MSAHFADAGSSVPRCDLVWPAPHRFFAIPAIDSALHEFVGPLLQEVTDNKQRERDHQQYDCQRNRPGILKLLQTNENELRRNLALERDVSRNENNRPVFTNRSSERQSETGDD